MSRSESLDEKYMQQALRLAEQGRGTTRPNPMVGAVVVRENRVLSTGFHHQAGADHAEIDALRKVGMQAPGATLYVTLEPCSHQGRTGPCSDAVIAAGVRRIVVGCRDENPRVAGKGIRKLRAAGLEVDVGCLEQACQRLNRPFFTWITQNRPFVTLKAAATLDGFIGDGKDRRRPRSTRWITGATARAHSQTIRQEHDAILVGVGTIEADNPQLTLRVANRRLFPLQRIILDSRLRCDPRAKVFHQRGALPPWIFAGHPPAGEAKAFLTRQRRLEATGAEVFPLATDPQGRPRRRAVRGILAKREIQSLLVEGGSQVHGAFIASGIVDRVLFYFAPSLVGGGVPIAKGTGPGFGRRLCFGTMLPTLLGKDVLIAAEVIGKNRPNQGK